uniref:FGENESH: predicted gene_16.33 protein n=1 Tax=Rhodotorula toruloides TaxID=5286 RepID=A0A0K3CV32_RHOTO
MVASVFVGSNADEPPHPPPNDNVCLRSATAAPNRTSRPGAPVGRDNPLKPFRHATLEGDEAVGFGVSVVGFLGLAEDNAGGVGPAARDVAEGERGAIEGNEVREEVREEKLEGVICSGHGSCVGNGSSGTVSAVDFPSPPPSLFLHVVLVLVTFAVDLAFAIVANLVVANAFFIVANFLVAVVVGRFRSVKVAVSATPAAPFCTFFDSLGAALAPLVDLPAGLPASSSTTIIDPRRAPLVTCTLDAFVRFKAAMPLAGPAQAALKRVGAQLRILQAAVSELEGRGAGCPTLLRAMAVLRNKYEALASAAPTTPRPAATTRTTAPTPVKHVPISTTTTSKPARPDATTPPSPPVLTLMEVNERIQSAIRPLQTDIDTPKASVVAAAATPPTPPTTPPQPTEDNHDAGNRSFAEVAAAPTSSASWPRPSPVPASPKKAAAKPTSTASHLVHIYAQPALSVAQVRQTLGIPSSIPVCQTRKGDVLGHLPTAAAASFLRLTAAAAGLAPATPFTLFGLVARNNKQHLRILLKELGPAPPQVPRKENRTIELPLYSQWEMPIQDITTASMPENNVTQNDILCLGLPLVAETAATSKDATLVRKGIKVKEMLRELEELKLVDRRDNYKLVTDEVTAELVHLGNLRKKVVLETRWLESVYKTICDHKAYLRLQLE